MLCILHVPSRRFFESLLVKIFKPNILYHFHVAKPAVNINNAGFLPIEKCDFRLEFVVLPVTQS